MTRLAGAACLQAVALSTSLEHLSVTLRGIRALRVPPDLARLAQLRSLELRLDGSQVGERCRRFGCRSPAQAAQHGIGHGCLVQLLLCRPRLLQMPSLLPPATPTSGGLLPRTLRRLVIENPPLRLDSAVALAADLPLLQACQLSRS